MQSLNLCVAALTAICWIQSTKVAENLYHYLPFCTLQTVLHSRADTRSCSLTISVVFLHGQAWALLHFIRDCAPNIQLKDEEAFQGVSYGSMAIVVVTIVRCDFEAQIVSRPSGNWLSELGCPARNAFVEPNVP